MKCEIIKDLIPLCSEGLCSEESRLAVEEHIRECESCRLLYEHIPENTEDIRLPEENSAMKKLSRKFMENRIRTAILGILLLALTGTLVMLTANQIDNDSPCFSTIFQSIEARKLAKCIINGDGEKYIELTLDPDEYHMLTSAESWEMIRKNEMEEFNAAYEEVLKGKDLHIDSISSEIYPSSSVQGTGMTAFYVQTRIILLADDLSAKYRIELRKNGSDRWIVETVMDDYFMPFDGNPDSTKVAKGLQMNTPFHLPESISSELVEFQSSDSAVWHFKENCRQRINENIRKFWENGYKFRDVKFSEIHYDCKNERFYYDMTIVGEDDKGTAALDMYIYSHSGYSREWLPCPADEQGLRCEGCTEGLKKAMAELFL